MSELRVNRIQSQSGLPIEMPTGLGYTAAGAGAVATNVQSKLREFVSVKDFGAVGDGVTNDSAAIQAAINTGKAVYIPTGTYLCNVTLRTAFYIYGDGLNATTLKPWSTSVPVIRNLYITGAWNYSTIKDINLESSGQVGVGFSFGDPAGYVTNHQYIGRVIMERMRFAGFDKGVFKTCGNIGNTYTDCQWTRNAYGWYAQDSARIGGGHMHATADRFYGGHLDIHTKSAIHLLDRSAGGGQLLFYGTILEGNPGFAVFMDLANNAGPAYIFDGVWSEANGTGGSTTVDLYSGTYTGTPKDYYFRGTRNVILRQSALTNIELVNSHLLCDYCDTALGSGPGAFSITKDSDSSIVYRGMSTEYFNDDGLVLAPYGGYDINIGGTNNNPQFSTLPGTTLVGGAGSGTILIGAPNTSARTYGGTSQVSASVVSDGMSHLRCQELTLGTTADGRTAAHTFTATTGKYYAITYQARKVSGGNATISLAGNFTLSTTRRINHSEWKQYSIVAKSPSTGEIAFSLAWDSAAAAVLRLGHCQVVQFDTQEEAINYLYSGRLAMAGPTVQVQSASVPLAGSAAFPGGSVNFNSGNFSVTVNNSSYRELLRCHFGGTQTQVVVDMLDAVIENSAAGAGRTQNAGFRTLTFSSLSETVTSTFGNCTVTFRWTNISGSAWALEAQITTGPATTVALTGIAFVKGN